MRTIHRRAMALACVAALLLPAAGAGQTPQQPHEHKQPADMAGGCKAMMADHQKMMAEMKAVDERLDALVAKMNAATGEAKVNATAEAVAELVAQRKTTRDRMLGMHQRMMSHMMQHMQAGPESAGTCPMMKMGAGGMKP